MSKRGVHLKNFRMPFGKYRGVLITRVPARYLLWCVKNGVTWAPHAQAELDRRGVKESQMEVSFHAFNRASQRLLSHWLQDREGDEGLGDWILRRAEEALVTTGFIDENGRVTHDGIVWIFDKDMERPTVVSCWLVGQKQEVNDGHETV